MNRYYLPQILLVVFVCWCFEPAFAGWCSGGPSCSACSTCEQCQHCNSGHVKRYCSVYYEMTGQRPPWVKSNEQQKEEAAHLNVGIGSVLFIAFWSFIISYAQR